MFNRYKTTIEAIPTTRRNFLKLMAGTGAGLTLGLHLPVSAETTKTETWVEGKFEPNAFVRIDEQGKVHLVMKHLEMGQGTHTGLATLIAEEMDANWNDIITEGAPADAQRYKNLFWGAQGTGGSSAMANSFEQMRMAGATARLMLVAAAAEAWKVSAAEVSVEQGVVSHKASGKSAGFGELALAAAKQPVPPFEDITLKSPKEFKYIGQNLSRKDTGKTDGTAVFTQDIKLDGMLTAVVMHPPRFGGVLKNFDASDALKVKGVVDVVEIPSGVAVVAKDYWSGIKGRNALKAEWDESKAIKQSSAELMDSFKQMADKPGLVARNDGNAKVALGTTDNVLEAEFEFPFLAHAAMEPMNCVAKVDAAGCEIWNGAQIQTMDQGAVANALGIKPEQVKINMLIAGGSFGRRAGKASDYVLEAVHIAKSQQGKPVKLVWSREDDTRGGYYRPMYFHKLKGGIDQNGDIVAWHQTLVGQSIVAGTPFEPVLVKDGIDKTSVEGAADMPYSIENMHVDLHTVDLPVPIQWWRAVGHTHTAFSTEVFLDLLAAKVGKDPVEVRASLLKNHPRELAVLKLAADKAGWGKTMPEGTALGVAVHKSFNTYVAQIAEVSLEQGGGFKLNKVTCAVDCGIAINPDIIKAQIEGGIGFGLSPVFGSEITLEEGRVKQSNFHDYTVLRINQMPEIDVHIVPSAEPPTGVGEPGTPPIAPAVANALFKLTGKPVTKLPITL